MRCIAECGNPAQLQAWGGAGGGMQTWLKIQDGVCVFGVIPSYGVYKCMCIFLLSSAQKHWWGSRMGSTHPVVPGSHPGGERWWMDVMLERVRRLPGLLQQAFVQAGGVECKYCTEQYIYYMLSVHIEYHKILGVFLCAHLFTVPKNQFLSEWGNWSNGSHLWGGMVCHWWLCQNILH